MFKTVRYSYISHENLLKLTVNPYKPISEAKPLIMEGLSFKLNDYENAIKDDLEINIEPRVVLDYDALPGGPNDPDVIMDRL